MTDPTELPPDDMTPTDAASSTEDGTPESGFEAVSAAEADALRMLSEQKDKYLRLFAEFENFRKRSVRERQEAELKGMGMLITGLLDSLDDLGRVAHVDPATTAAQSIVDGVEMVEKKILKSLSGHGLEVVNPVGEVFNPAVHEALTAVPAALPEEDERVAQVYQVGYVFHGQLLRPARVVVKQWPG
jgi:molecular chaperone GrpE